MSDNLPKTDTSNEIQQATQAPDGLTVNTPSGDVKVNPAVTTINGLKRAVSEKMGNDRMIVFNKKSGSGAPLRDHELLANHPSAEWVVVFDEPFLIGQNCTFYGSPDAAGVEIVQKRDGMTVTVQVVLERPLSDYTVGDRIRLKKVLRIDWKRIIDRSHASFFPDENFCEDLQLTKQVIIHHQNNGYTARRILPTTCVTTWSDTRIICIPGTLTNGRHVYHTTNEIGFDGSNGLIGTNYQNISPKTDDNGNLSWKVAINGIENTFEDIDDARLWRDIIEYYTPTVLHRPYGSYCGVPPSVRELNKQDKIERALQIADLPPTKPSVTTADFKQLWVALQLRHAIVLYNITNNESNTESNIEIVAEIQTGIERALAMMEQLFETVFKRTEKVVSHLVTCVLQPSTVASLKSIQTQLTAKKSQITGQGHDIMKNGPVIPLWCKALLQDIWKAFLWKEMNELETMKDDHVYEERALIQKDVSVIDDHVMRSISDFAFLWALLNDAIENADVVEVVKKDLSSLNTSDVVIVRTYSHRFSDDTHDDTHFEVVQVDHCKNNTSRLAILRNGGYKSLSDLLNNPDFTLFRFKKKEEPPTKKPRLGEYGM